MSTISTARRSRAVLAALALAAFSVSVVPLASTAAAPSPAARATATPVAKATTAKTTSASASKTPSSKSVSTASSKKTPPASGTVAAKKKAPAKAKSTAYQPHTGPAPADEYFGRLGMSILGVRSKVKDLGLQADLHPDQDGAVLRNALWVEDAMRDWAKKYPFDRWLPRYAYALEQMYERIPGDDAHKRALKQISYLTAYFPQTLYGRVGRAKLVAGIPEPDPSFTPEPLSDLQRLALLDGKVQPTMPPASVPSTPHPTPVATPAPVILPETLPSAEPSGTPAPAASPAAPVPANAARP